MNYSNNVVINITMMLLVILGGLGFTVWTDITGVIKKHLKENIEIKKLIKELTLHTKIVLTTTAILLITGTFFIFIFEFNNLNTIANNTLSEKILKSAFQSTTLRTAGFYTINQNEMTTVTKLISMCYMFIGGSPGSTAGGIKNVTIFVVILLIMSYMKDKEKINVFKRRITESSIKRAIVVFAISILIIIVGVILLLLSETFVKEELLISQLESGYTFSFIDILFEVISAFGTVGLTLGITSSLSLTGKVIIIFLMIIGRLRTSNNINSTIKK